MQNFHLIKLGDESTFFSHISPFLRTEFPNFTEARVGSQLTLLKKLIFLNLWSIRYFINLSQNVEVNISRMHVSGAQVGFYT